MDFVTVARFPLPQDAYVARSLLEAEDIPVFLANELTIQVHNLLSAGLGGVELRVPREHALRARRRLEEGGLVPELTVPDDPGWLRRFDRRTADWPWLGRQPVELRVAFAAAAAVGLVLLLALGVARWWGGPSAEGQAPAAMRQPRAVALPVSRTAGHAALFGTSGRF
jgi:hypothetical protein